MELFTELGSFLYPLKTDLSLESIFSASCILLTFSFEVWELMFISVHYRESLLTSSDFG